MSGGGASARRRIAAAGSADPKAKDAAKRGWQAICDGHKPHSAAEPDMDEAAAWLTEHQEQIGVRTAMVSEKATAVGLGHYFRTIALDEQQKADAIGNAFDKDLVGRRLELGLKAALS
eukprot:15474213-Alexandrium_andersonii.AAC.1